MIKVKQISKKEEKLAESFSKQEWLRFNKERGYNYKPKKFKLVAKENSKIIGFADFEIIGGASYLDQLIISKDKQRQGVWKKLLDEYERISKKNGSHILYLETSNVHKEALRFYKKEGYRKIAKLNNFKFHFTWYIFAKEVAG